MTVVALLYPNLRATKSFVIFAIGSHVLRLKCEGDAQKDNAGFQARLPPSSTCTVCDGGRITNCETLHGLASHDLAVGLRAWRYSQGHVVGTSADDAAVASSLI